MSKIRKALKSVLPQAVVDFYRDNFSKSTKWVGNFSSWEEAVNNSTGYDSEKIISRVFKSTLEVVSGRAKYEQDSILFYEEEFDTDLINLVSMVSKKNKKVTVLDYGGALGSTYFKNKKFLSKIKGLNWCVVEQEKFVELGKANFADKTLQFYPSLDSFFEKKSPNIVLFSSVLQYLEKPFEVINEVISKKPLFILVIRTPFTQNQSRICIQKVNPDIYPASYPCHIFNEAGFIKAFAKKYSVISSSINNDYSGKDISFESFTFRRV